MAASSPSVPPVLRLLADPVRWQLMRELAASDQRVRELMAALGQPQNLVSYHLRQLRAGGLVAARRSSFDRRDTYYRLDLDGCAQALAAASSALHPGLALLPDALLPDSLLPDSLPPEVLLPGGPGRAGERATPGRTNPEHAVPERALSGPVPSAGVSRRRVLFVCTGNSGRSPMAEALLRHRAGHWVETASAGIRPRQLQPEAVAVMRDRYRIDIVRHWPTPVTAAAREPFDYVISLCDKAREACPEFPGRPALIHWSLPDPAAGEGGLAGYPAYERTAAELDTRIRYFLPALAA